MNFEIEKKHLLDHLNIVIKGVSTRNIIPILNCIKLTLTNDGLYLLATDNDLTIESFIELKNIANIDTLGTIVISGRYFHEIIKKMPNEKIKIEQILDEKINISTTNTSFTLNTNNPNDYPEIIFEENKTPVLLETLLFKDLILETSYAASMLESRPILTGINMKIENKILQLTATDSYRLVKKTLELDESYETNIDITIPYRNIIEIIKTLNNKEIINLHIFNNKITFIIKNLKITSSLINGDYPNTNKLIPESFLIDIKINKDILINSIDRASLLTSENDKNTINCEINKNELIISSNIPEIGNVKDVILLESPIEENFKISYSSKYMLDALKNINGEEVILSFNDSIKPFIIKNKENNNSIHLIVPIRTY